MLTNNKQDQQVAEFLKSINVTYDVKYIGAFDHEEWKCDKWAIFFNHEVFNFSTGIGHRIERNKSPSRYRDKLKSLRELTGVTPASHKIEVNRGHPTGMYAVTPTQASVLYSLLLDSSAQDESFNNWCDDCGLDSDSLKALNTYQACIANAEKLNKILKREQIAKLNEILEDY